MNGKLSRRDPNGVPHISEYARLKYGYANTARHRPASGTQNVGYKNRKWKSRRRAMSANVDSDTGRSGVVEIVGVAVGIASPSLSVQKILSTSGFVADILGFRCRRCRAVSAVPYFSRTSTKIWGIRCNRVAIASRSKGPISTYGLCRGHFEFPTLTDVGHCRPMSAVTQAVQARSKLS